MPRLPVPVAALRAVLSVLPTRASPCYGTRDRSACICPSAGFPPSLQGCAMYCRRTPASRLGLAACTRRTATAGWPLARARGRARQASGLAERGCRPCACRGTGGARACRTRRRRGLACSAGAACPPTPRRSLRSAVGRTVFYCRAVCCRAPVAGRVLLPLTACRGRGDHGGGRPLAAACGCRLQRRFFFLLKTRNVILAGPRQGQASLRSVRQRTLDMACSARIGAAQEGGRKRTNAAATGRVAARGRTACFTPRRHGTIWRSGGSTGTRRCTAAAHSPQKNPLEEDR